MEATEWVGVRRDGRDLFTPNARPGERVYGEVVRNVDGIEYRHWDPFRSKLAAYLIRAQPPRAPWSAGGSVLYLGGGHGTTVSHLSDLVGAGVIYVVEKSPEAFAPLLALARKRTNIYPILADAQLPERYQADVGRVGFIYQDVAQRHQASIFVENARTCLAPKGRGLLMLKVRSVTQRRPANAIVREARHELGRAGLTVATECSLAPFSKEHTALAVTS